MTDPDTPKILNLADGLYVRQAVDNMAWIDLGGWAVVVDALEQPDLEGEVFEAVAATIGETPVRFVLNTHTHRDHVALNEAFRRRFQAEIVNLRTQSIGPEGRWLEGPRRRLQVLPMAGCHSNEDCVVWLPRERVLFAGDLFGWGMIPTTRPLDDETAELLTDTYARLIAFDAATVVPGHGPRCTTAELVRWVEYFHWLEGRVAEACAQGKSERQVVDETPPPEDMKTWWRLALWKHAHNVARVFRAARRGR